MDKPSSKYFRKYFKSQINKRLTTWYENNKNEADILILEYLKKEEQHFSKPLIDDWKELYLEIKKEIRYNYIMPKKEWNIMYKYFKIWEKNHQK